MAFKSGGYVYRSIGPWNVRVRSDRIEIERWRLGTDPPEPGELDERVTFRPEDLAAIAEFARTAGLGKGTHGP